MDRPFNAFRPAEVACPVQWVQDPHPVGLQAGPVVSPLLGQESVIGTELGQTVHQVAVGLPVPLVLQAVRRPALGDGLAPDPEEQVTGFLG